MSLNVKNPCNAFTYPSNRHEVFHFQVCLSSVSRRSSVELWKTSTCCVVLLVAITALRDSHSCSSGLFSGSKFSLVGFLVLVVRGVDLGLYYWLLLSSELESPVGPKGVSIVLIVSSSWGSNPYSSASYSASFATELPPSVCCWKHCWCLLSSPRCSVTGSRPLSLLSDSWNLHRIPYSSSISSVVSGPTFMWRVLVKEAISSSLCLVIPSA